MNPIEVPTHWEDSNLLTFEQFCTLIHTPQRTVRDWRRRGVGPRWSRFNGTGRLYTTVAETRRWLGIPPPMTSPAAGRAKGSETRATRGLLTIDEAAAYLNVPSRWSPTPFVSTRCAAPASASMCGSGSNTSMSSWAPANNP